MRISLTRSAAALALTCLMYVPLTCVADISRDGNWWNTLAHGEKLAYVIGVLDGQLYAEVIYQGAGLEVAANPKTGQLDRARLVTLNAMDQRARGALQKDFGNVSAGNLVQGLDHIFSDYRNARISVLDALMVVARSLGGMSDEGIEKMLEDKRSGATAAFK